MDEWDDNVASPHAPQVSSRSTTTAAVKNKLPAGATAALKNKKPAGVKKHVTKRETRVTATKNKCATVKAKPAAKAKLAAKTAKLNLGLSLSPTPDDLSSWLKANPWSKPTLPDVILTGSDCSGLGTDEECYKELGLSTKCMFACEKDLNMRQYFIALHGHPPLFYTDITVRTVYTECDIYTAGYPCQPWSLAGKGGGLNDTRGMPCIHGLEYIREKRPRLVVLEQVKGMLTRFKQILMPSSGILSILAITSVGEFSIHLMLEHFRRIVRDSTWWQSAKIHSCTNSNGPSRSRHVRFQIFLMHASGGLAHRISQRPHNKRF